MYTIYNRLCFFVCPGAKYTANASFFHFFPNCAHNITFYTHNNTIPHGANPRLTQWQPLPVLATFFPQSYF